MPRFDCGIPVDWITAEDLRVWPSLEGKAVAFDPADPPLYEAQAEYLRRHRLFAPGERRRLRRADVAPEAAEL